jgi:mannose-6-phosphate isomerase-like protein (cupin superfamily)
VLVRRHSEAAVTEWHRLRSHILMDAGELGSRHMSVTWIELPAGAAEKLHSHEEAEQVYVVVRGSGAMSAAGDTERLEAGDLALIPPATLHSIANDGEGELALVSVQAPAVSVEELYERQLAANAAGYDEFADDDEY